MTNGARIVKTQDGAVLVVSAAGRPSSTHRHKWMVNNGETVCMTCSKVKGGGR